MVEEKVTSRKTLQNLTVEKISLPLFLDERIDGVGVFAIFDLNVRELHFDAKIRGPKLPTKLFGIVITNRYFVFV